MRMPLARDVVEAVAVDHGVCVRPVAVRRTDMRTGDTVVVDVPCGSTLATVCRPCAVRKKRLRMAQCREGWHLETEPVFAADEPNREQRELATVRADLTAGRDEAVSAGDASAEWDEAIREIDGALAAAGVRGNVDPAARARRVRSTRRRQDAPRLPKRRIERTTLGRIYAARGGKVFRPSVFLTLTCDGYGRVRQDGTPIDSDTYDYRRAARDAIHFGKVVDRFVQNLRRVAGYDVQYFATVEPQRRLAPHLHLAMRGTVSRAELRMIAAATYHQVWWPSSEVVKFECERLPVWDSVGGGYFDPETGEALPTWDQALDAIGPEDEPAHVARFGPQLHAEGVIAGSPDAQRCIGYLTKYLTKSIDQCHEPETAAQQAHVDRLCEALRFEPCSPTCANWLRYGVQPSNARPGLKPGHCRGKAHLRQHLGYGGRRVLVSRKWSGKTLADHKNDRRAFVLATLGVDVEAAESAAADRYAWQLAKPGDPDVAPLAHRLLRAVAERQRWREQYERARAMAIGQGADLSATAGRAS
jgi:hypothetical protein